VIDFILKWREKLKNTPTSPLTIKIHNELESLQVIKEYSNIREIVFFQFLLLFIQILCKTKIICISSVVYEFILAV